MYTQQQHLHANKSSLSGLCKSVLCSTLLWLAACADEQPGSSEPATAEAIGDSTRVQYDTYDWVDLLPEKDLQALLNPPPSLFEIEEGAADDTAMDPLKAAPPMSNQTAYQQALTSTGIKPELDGETIRIAGFVVPLEFDTDQSVTQFFLVPYFGACIHVPPPPPNQLILVDSDKKLDMKDIYQPYWIEGKLQTTLHENDVATSAYSMELHYAEVYTEQQ